MRLDYPRPPRRDGGSVTGLSTRVMPLRVASEDPVRPGQRRATPATGTPAPVLALQVMGFVSLGLLLAGILCFHLAEPQAETFLDRQLDARVRRMWDPQLLALSGQLLRGNLLLCAAGVMANGLVDHPARAAYLRALAAMGLATAAAMLAHHWWPA